MKIKTIIAVLALLATSTAKADGVEFIRALNLEASSATNELCRTTMELSHEQCEMLFFETSILGQVFRNAHFTISACSLGQASKLKECRSAFVRDSLENFRNL